MASNYENPTNNRQSDIMKASITGIVANVLLSIFKAGVGFFTHSIAISLDAINNLSDAVSSVITVIGTKLASQTPDYKHPFGHGRVEYISAMTISVIILYAGFTALIESIKKIISPVTPEYSVPSLVIIVVAVLVKVWLSRYSTKVGKRTNSQALQASGLDARNDVFISATTLLAAIIYMTTGVSLEAYLGAAISIVILKAGYDVLMETINILLGERVDKSLSIAIKRTISSIDGVNGAYDLYLHNYGPDIYLGSVHIEVDDNLTISELDGTLRKISDVVYDTHNVVMTAIGIYASNTSRPDIIKMRNEIYKLILTHQYVKNLHGFYVSEENNLICLDLVVEFGAPDIVAICNHVKAHIEEEFPGYTVNLKLDEDISD